MKKRTSKDIFGDALLALAKTEKMERITVKQIVETSGLSLQTFYNHFRDKDDLIAWLHQQGDERAAARLEGGRSSLHELTMDSIRFYAENANFMRGSFSCLSNPYAEMSTEGMYRFLFKLICRRHGLESLPEELDFYLRMYVYACLYIFSEWSENRALPEEQLAAYLEQGMPEKLKPYLLD